MSATWQYRPCGVEGFDTGMKISRQKSASRGVPGSDQITKDTVDKFASILKAQIITGGVQPPVLRADKMY